MSKESDEQKLFDMVYEWGRVGIVVNHMAPAFQRAINDIRSDEVNKARALIWGFGFDDDPTAVKLREQLFERIQYLKSLNNAKDVS